jgi:hypothetical protein
VGADQSGLSRLHRPLAVSAAGAGDRVLGAPDPYRRGRVTRAGGPPSRRLRIRCRVRGETAADCARTTVWDAATDERIIDEVVLDDGEMVTFDDRLVLHDVSPLVPAGDVADAYRDVIILTYPDHSKTLEHGKVVTSAQEGDPR